MINIIYTRKAGKPHSASHFLKYMRKGSFLWYICKYLQFGLFFKSIINCLRLKRKILQGFTQLLYPAFYYYIPELDQTFWDLRHLYYLNNQSLFIVVSKIKPWHTVEAQCYFFATCSFIEMFKIVKRLQKDFDLCHSIWALGNSNFSLHIKSF